MLFSSLDLSFLQYLHNAQWIQETIAKLISKFVLFHNIRHNSDDFWDNSLLIHGLKAISSKILEYISTRNNCSIRVQHILKREEQKSDLTIHSYIERRVSIRNYLNISGINSRIQRKADIDIYRVIHVNIINCIDFIANGELGWSSMV